MASRTIPAPSHRDWHEAFGTLLRAAQHNGCNVATDEALLTTLNQCADVNAQLNAEVRFLRNLLHTNPRGVGIVRGEVTNEICE
jgi:hypothetical protein